MQLLLRLVYPLPILTIDDEHQALSAGVVMSPKRADLVLPSYVPDIELDVLIRDRLNVEADYGSQSKRVRMGGLCVCTGLDNNAPVGIVVTDWFSLSLYKIAVE
jgi:hypothetical protein